MQKDSHAQRLQEIREKYGIFSKGPGSSHKPSQPFKNQENDQLKKKGNQSCTLNKRLAENIDPSSPFLPTKYSLFSSKQKQTAQTYDSFLYAQSKEERMKEIQKIRQSVRATQQLIKDDRVKEIEKSKPKHYEIQRQAGLRQKTNTYKTSNLEDYRILTKNTPTIEEYRNKVKSSMSIRIDSDLQLEAELRRNYDCEPFINRKPQSDKKALDSTALCSSIKSNSVSKFGGQSSGLSAKKQGQVSRLSAKKTVASICTEFNSAKIIQNESISPIRGLQKLESMERIQRSDKLENYQIGSKFVANSYDMSNIDKIQERIQKILAKK